MQILTSKELEDMNFEEYVKLAKPTLVGLEDPLIYFVSQYDLIYIHGYFNGHGEFVGISFYDYGKDNFYKVGSHSTFKDFSETTLEDIVEKIEAVKAGKEYSTDVAFEIDEDVFIELARLAHKRNITVNQMAVELITQYIDDHS